MTWLQCSSNCLGWVYFGLHSAADMERTWRRRGCFLKVLLSEIFLLGRDTPGSLWNWYNLNVPLLINMIRPIDLQNHSGQNHSKYFIAIHAIGHYIALDVDYTCPDIRSLILNPGRFTIVTHTAFSEICIPLWNKISWVYGRPHLKVILYNFQNSHFF